VSVENAKNRGERIDPALSRITLGGWAQQWIESQAHLKPSKRDRYERILEVQILPEWERVRLSAITHADVVGWVARLSADGYAAATIRQVHRVFSLLLGLAVRDGRLSRNPAEGVGLPRVTPEEPKFLSHEQVDQLADACGPYGLFVRTLAYTGLRWGERPR
jgi:integrase